MRKRVFFILSTLLFIISTVNYFFRKHLKYGYAQMLSYSQLYCPDERLQISNIALKNDDSIEIKFTGSLISDQNKFNVYSDQETIVNQKSPLLKFKMFPERRVYKIVINSSPDTVFLEIDYTPESIYASRKNSSKSSVEITPYSITVKNKNSQSLSYWNWKNQNDIVDEAIIESYIKDSMRIAKSDLSEIKVMKIASYTLGLISDKYGIPSDSLQKLNPIQQLTAARNGMSALWCGNYANLFSFFANKCGLTTRLVETGHLENGIINSPHVFNEVYLQEYGLWAYVDFTDRNVFVRNNNKYLNAVDIYRLQRYNANDNGIRATYFEKNRFIDTPFFKSSFFGKRALNYNNTIHFYYGNYSQIASNENIFQRVSNFFYPNPFFAVYSDNISLIDNEFDLRVVSNYLLLSIFLLWIFWAVYSLVRFTK